MNRVRPPKYDFRAVKRSIVAINKAAVDRQRAKDECVLGRYKRIDSVLRGGKWDYPVER